MRKKEELELFELCFTFFRIGLFTFGGGYAMIALIEDICVERKK
jgi:chromate transporter